MSNLKPSDSNMNSIKDNESLIKRLEHVNNWINNCDQKAGILLAFMGVLLPLILTADFFVIRLSGLVEPIKSFWVKGDGFFDWCNFFRLAAFVIMLFFAARTIIYLIFVLTGKTDYSKFKQNKLEKKSAFFYGSIAGMKYKEFKEMLINSQYDSTTDLISQIYVNSVICESKFDNYKLGLRNMIYFLCVFAVTYIIFLFIK